MLLGCGMTGIVGCNKPSGGDAPAALGGSGAAAPSTAAVPTTSPKETWDGLIRQAQADIEAGRIDDAQKKLAELDKIYIPPAKPDEAQKAALTALTKQVSEFRAANMGRERAAKLAEAQTLFKDGKFEEAEKAASLVLNLAPTLEQENLAKQLGTAIDERRKSRRGLESSMRFLNSDDPREVASARLQLPQRPDDAMPLLIEASADATKPKLVQRALALMVQIDRPKLSIPAMVAILKRPEQKENWPDAIQALERANKPGAGELLLDLALKAPTPEGQVAALTALSKVVDTPQRTVPALLPLVSDSGPVSAAALAAITHAVQALDQTDLVARRSLDATLTTEDQKNLGELPSRLLKLSAGGEGIAPEVQQQAKALAAAVHLINPEPLKGVAILRTGSAVPESPATAAVDGVWNSIDPATMWCYPATGRGTILLDLGSERTVTGVRIWNLNTANAATLGWKEVRVIVSSDPSEVRSPKLGQVPPAPATANSTDYSVLIPVGVQRGRYVEIAAISLWGTAEGNSGLAEIQVLGF